MGIVKTKEMDQGKLLEVLNDQAQIRKLQETNCYAEHYGLTLTEEDTKLLVEERRQALHRTRRVEFGGGILPQIVMTFCDSQYITQDSYVDILTRLQEIFYTYKNEIRDEITDDELLAFMKEQYETICCGDLEYLESTCLELFAQAIRAGYDTYQLTGGEGIYENMDLVKRWERELYMEALRELFWG
ncbi:MAG: DUF6323 family protein [Lachnospiraceae bacterium]|nr:DUF6323 family protein [Lachnospiraceae bacterium]